MYFAPNQPLSFDSDTTPEEKCTHQKWCTAQEAGGNKPKQRLRSETNKAIPASAPVNEFPGRKMTKSGYISSIRQLLDIDKCASYFCLTGRRRSTNAHKPAFMPASTLQIARPPLTGPCQSSLPVHLGNTFGRHAPCSIN